MFFRSVVLSSLFLCIGQLGFAAETSETSPFSLTGRAYTDQYFPLTASSTYESGIFQSSFSAWLDFTANISKNANVHLVGQGDSFIRSMADTEKSSGSVRLREGYFQYSTDAVEFKIGQQIIPWGKSDGVNPTDYFTAKDYTLLNPDDEVRRLGAPAVMFSFTPQKGSSPLNFIGVFQGVYPQNHLIIPTQAIPAQAIAAGIQFQRYSTAPTAFQSDTVEFGGKISYLDPSFDLSISAFRGVNHTAQYTYHTATNLISPVHVQQTAIGGDGSITAGNYVFRAETAYIVPDLGKEGSELYGVLQPAHWDTTFGAERSFFEDFHFQVQGLYRYQIAYLDPSLYSTPSAALTQIQRAVARANGLLLNSQRISNFGATFRIGFMNESSSWTADTTFVAYLTGGQDFLWRSQVGFKADEGLRFLLGTDVYGGDDTRPLGSLKKNSSVFFEVRYLF